MDANRPATTRLTLTLLISILTVFPPPTHAQQNTPLVIVDIAEQRALIEEIPLSGSVISPRVAELSAEVSGIVDTLTVDIGDTVSTGDELLRLDAELHRLALAAAQAASEQARQALADAKRRLANAEALAKRQTVSANELQSLAAEVRIDSAALEGLVAEQQRQEAMLRRYTLTAPFAGVISRKQVEVGEWVQPGDAVLTLVATTGLRLDFQAPQTAYGKLARATGAAITLDALPQQIFSGRIDAVIPVTDPDSRTFLIRVALDDAQAVMTPGMSATAVLRVDSGREGVVVPRDALLRYPDGRITVWVVGQNSNETTVTERLVQTGLNFNGKVTITQGLAAGARVVVQGNEALRDGQAVTVKLLE